MNPSLLCTVLQWTYCNTQVFSFIIFKCMMGKSLVCLDNTSCHFSLPCSKHPALTDSDTMILRTVLESYLVFVCFIMCCHIVQADLKFAMEPKMTLNFYLSYFYLLNAAFQVCSVWFHTVLDVKQAFSMLDKRSTCTAPGTKVAGVFFIIFFFWLRKWTSGSVLSLQG